MRKRKALSLLRKADVESAIGDGSEKVRGGRRRRCVGRLFQSCSAEMLKDLLVVLGLEETDGRKSVRQAFD